MSTEIVSWWQLAHAGAQAPESDRFRQRAAGAASLLGSIPHATILISRDSAGPKIFLGIPRGPQAAMFAGSLARAVGAQHQGLDGPPEVDSSSGFATLVCTPTSHLVRQTQAGFSPGDVALAVAEVLPEGCWAAVTLRQPSGGEFNRTMRWFNHRLNGVATHYSKEKGAVVASFTAGGGNAADRRALLNGIADAMPGFDMGVDVVEVGGRVPVVVGGLGLSAAGGGAVRFVAERPELFTVSLLPGLAVAAVGATGLLHDPRRAMSRRVAQASFPAPGSLSGLRVRAPRKESTKQVVVDGEKTTRTVAAFDGTYPLPRTAFWLGNGQVLSLACPHFGAAAGAAVSRQDDVPSELVEPSMGALLGQVGAPGSEVDVHASSANLYETLFVTGLAGTGKSVVVNNVFAYECLDWSDPSGRPGHLGDRNALICFENKSAKGVAGYTQWMGAFNVPGFVVDMGGADTPAIDMLGPGSITDKTNTLVSQMVYAFGVDAIGNKSQMTLKQVFPLAMLLTDVDAERAGLAPDTSFMGFAHALLGSLGDKTGVDLYQSAVRRVQEASNSGGKLAELEAALRAISPLYGQGVTQAKRAGAQDAPMSKVDKLMSVASWWSPNRARITFEDVLEHHQVLVVNIGEPLDGGILTDDEATGVLGSMLLHRLRAAVKRTCNGWRDAGRGVTLFGDELSLLVGGNDASVVKWLRNQGREFGVRQVWATQYPDQLSAEVSTVMMSSGALLCMRQKDVHVLDQMASALSASGGPAFTADRIAQLPNFEGVLSATVGDRPVPAVGLRTMWWPDADAVAFRRAHHR